MMPHTSPLLSLFLCATVVPLTLLTACKQDPPSPAPAASTSPPAAVKSAAPAASMAASAVASAAPAASGKAHPETCEVEFFGQVKPVENTKLTPVVFASYDDCLSPAPRNIGQSSTQPDGKFFLEVFVKWGSDLTLCAYQPTAGDKPTKLYGKAAGPFHAEKEGEVEFKNVTIDLKAGTARPFPKPRVSGGF